MMRKVGAVIAFETEADQAGVGHASQFTPRRVGMAVVHHYNRKIPVRLREQTLDSPPHIAVGAETGYRRRYAEPAFQSALNA